MARTVVPPSPSTWLTSVGVPIRCWRPELGEPQALEWWEPFLTICRRARDDRFPWPLWLDEFELIGRVDRPDRPAIWVYRHRRARRELYCDDGGATYRLVPKRRGPAPGQFRRCELRTALFGAAVHAVVDPHWWQEPEDRRPDRDVLDRPDWTVPPPRYRWIDDDLDDDERWPRTDDAASAPRTAQRVSPSLRLIEGEGAAPSPRERGTTRPRTELPEPGQSA